MKSQAISSSSTQTQQPWWVPKRQARKELIDSFDQPMDDLLGTFQDIQRFNRLFGGRSMVLFHVGDLMRSFRGDFNLLDVATGIGDIPCAILDFVHERGRKVKITALDANENVLHLAETYCGVQKDLTFVPGDATNLPFPDNSFDIVLCSLTIHHFDDATAADAISEMARVCRHGIVVSDLRRSYLAAFLIWMISRVFFMNRLSKHDAHLSVLRSRTIPEYRRLVSLARLHGAKVCKHAFWRAAIVWRKT